MNYLFAKRKLHLFIFHVSPGVRAFANNSEGLGLALFSTSSVFECSEISYVFSVSLAEAFLSIWDTETCTEIGI